MADFDVFLSYTADQRPVVVEVASELRQMGLRVWYDQWIQPPGRPWQRQLLEGVKQSASIAIFVSAHGLGKWQEIELEAAVERQVSGEDHRVIPVVLPGVSDDDIALPPLLKRVTWIRLRENLQEAGVLEHLYWGITGRKYAGRQIVASASDAGKNWDSAIEHAVAGLRDTLKSDNITYFIGTGAAQGSDVMPPSADEITRSLLLDLQLIGADYSQLLPPVEVAGSYYAAALGASRLERKIVDLVARRSSQIPETHRQLSALIALLAKRPKPRVRRRVQQLIVTTNVDVLLERALLRSGTSFTRLVQHTAAPRIEINRYQGVTRSGDGTIRMAGENGSLTIHPDDWDELDDAIANVGRSTVAGSEGDTPSGSSALHKLPLREIAGDDPILYKFRGSQDVRSSCALSAEQYLRYLRGLMRQNVVPAQVAEILTSSPLVLLGYGYFDTDFKLLYHGLLRQVLELRQDPVYLVQPRPEQEPHDAYRKMELALWDRVKVNALGDLKISTLETTGEEFLKLLTESARDQLAATP